MKKKMKLVTLQYKQPKFIYIAGPMVGYKKFNKKAFTQAEKLLRNSGYVVVNPDRLTDDLRKKLGREPNRQECLKADFHNLTTCDAIYMLKGWSHSPGANKERQIALDCGLQVFYQEDFERKKK